MSAEPTVYMLGFRERVTKPVELPIAVRWLAGEDVPINEELLNGIRHECARQEKYRNALIAALQRAQSKFLRRSSENVPSLENPPADMTEAYWSGFGCGVYSAMSECASELAEMSAVAATEGAG